ncbi:MAG: twin-arginine translocase TatA/TatE family subunit [Actinobacteria bacterium]|nr:twin-arginine translocase TatA/TatE family subunit [Actinomycetota bacterium]
MGTGLLSPSHIMVLLVVVLLVFGARRLPELGRSLGSGMREFKDSVSGEGTTPEIGAGAPTQAPQAVAEATDARVARDR